ncbi:MAG: hypothetical protein IJ787_07295 [Bacilli bacterium]|nr:hypothetical protein [Bacilli bacterium]
MAIVQPQRHTKRKGYGFLWRTTKRLISDWQRKGLSHDEELLKGLSEEQIAKVKTCKNQEEILKFAKEEGIEPTDEQFEAVIASKRFATPPSERNDKNGI